MIKLRRDLVEQIYDLLRERITDLNMKPGARINIQKLAEEFDVSPTPIKDALKKLSQEGLVTTKSGKGYYVVCLSPEKLNEIYDLRKMFESYALKAAIQNIPAEKSYELKEEMENLKQEMNEEEKNIKFYQKDQMLHLEIIRNSNNKVLEEFYRQIYDLVKISQHLYKTTEESLEEHIRIVEAMLEKNLAKARKDLETHINHARDKAIRALQNRVSPWESKFAQSSLAEK